MRLTLVERKSRYTLAQQLDCRGSEGITEAVIAPLSPHKGLRQTITFDSGKKFAQQAFIADSLDADVYLAHPYHSWERGLNETTSGLLRQYFPKSTNLRKVTQHEVNEALYEFNHHRPKMPAVPHASRGVHGLGDASVTPKFSAICC